MSHIEVRVWHGFSVHWAWLAGGFVLAFAVPYLLADVFEINRDLFYGLYALAVIGLFALWSRSTGLRPGRSRQAALARGALARVGRRGCPGRDGCWNGGRDRTADGLELAGAVAWRGILYGITDGLLLSVFPILVVFAAFAGTRLSSRLAGKVMIGIVALTASFAMTAVYHSGYSDFRSDKMTKPLRGDLIWSAPTLLTLNPIGAPIAHAALHTTAVLHSYETETFLPPHR